MAGNQSRGLVQVSKTKGWDPTKIPAGGGQGEVDLSKVDVDPGNLPGPYVGRLVGPPADAADGYDSSIGAPSVPFNTPDVGREDPTRHRSARASPYPAMRNSHPTPGKPGA